MKNGLGFQPGAIHHIRQWCSSLQPQLFQLLRTIRFPPGWLANLAMRDLKYVVSMSLLYFKSRVCPFFLFKKEITQLSTGICERKKNPLIPRSSCYCYQTWEILLCKWRFQSRCSQIYHSNVFIPLFWKERTLKDNPGKASVFFLMSAKTMKRPNPTSSQCVSWYVLTVCGCRAHAHWFLMMFKNMSGSVISQHVWELQFLAKC